MDRLEALKQAKSFTMKCWWPSKSFLLDHPNWEAIIHELFQLMDYPADNEEYKSNLQAIINALP